MFEYGPNGGPEGIRTHDLTDANELKTLICIDFQTFPALSAGMQMALWPLFPVVTMCPGSVCGTRCGHRKTGGKASILGAPIIARNRKSVNGFLNPWRRKPLDAINLLKSQALIKRKVIGRKRV